MKKAITNETITKIFAQYFKQDVYYSGMNYRLIGIFEGKCSISRISSKGKIVLTVKPVNKVSIIVNPLSKITNEQCELIGFTNYRGLKNWMKRNALTNVDANILKQLGYALDFSAIQDGEYEFFYVDDLVELNVFKYISNDGI